MTSESCRIGVVVLRPLEEALRRGDRIHGVLSRSLATMPLGRILDIAVVKPLAGRILGYGHFTFESAAQEQGLRDIRYVAKPLARDLVIQRHVQLSGLRGPRLDHDRRR